MPIEIGGHPIGSGHPLFVIAELGLNHDGVLDRALALVDAAAASGASGVKLQTLRADQLVAESSLAPAHVAAASLREYFRRFELDADAHRAIAQRARRHGLALLSTPFCDDAVDLLETIGCDAYKIASGDMTHHRLIARVARTGKPVIISTGMSEMAEVRAALACARSAGAIAVALLHCVSAYPVPAGAENLRAITALAREFPVPVGLSDHGTDPMAAALAVALGATIYEKHLMLDGHSGIDAVVSVTATELGAIVQAADRAQHALGDGRRVCAPVEAANRLPSRRSLYAARDLRAGDVVSSDAIIALRPASGLDARRWFDLVGRRIARDVDAGSPFLDGDLEPEAVGRLRGVA